MFKKPKLYAAIFGGLAAFFMLLPRLTGAVKLTHISGALGMMFFLFAVVLLIGKTKP
ncbi:MAG: hypothetical protein ACKVTZ_19370 [Bacteroidia bacterium]